MGREGKGAQVWLTEHLSPAEQVPFSFRNVKAAKDFVPGGTTQNLWQVAVVKWFKSDLELRASASYERWRAPVYRPGLRQDFTSTVQLTWFPKSSHPGSAAVVDC